ncbi:signal peptidase I [Glaciihabitans sp. INWT7]|nr:signal peptidase I [Glaciihabitans sp. INWT7]
MRCRASRSATTWSGNSKATERFPRSSRVPTMPAQRESLASARPTIVLAAWTWLFVRLVARLSLSFVLALAVFSIVPLAFGMTGSDVFGGSMRPHLQAGDVVLSFPLDKDAPTPMGRVVTFHGSGAGKSSDLIVHRIVGKNKDGTLITAGDANIEVDSASLKRSDIIARAWVLIPWVGLPLLWLSTGGWVPFSIWVVLTLLALLVEVIGDPGPRTKRNQAPFRAKHPAFVRAIPGIAAGVALAIAATFALVALNPANAVFTSQTSSVGNNWVYPAATAPTKLVFAVNPSSGTGGARLAVQPSVRLLDAAGKPTTGTARAITLTLTNPAGAALACAANPVTTTSGISTFSACAVDKAGT